MKHVNKKLLLSFLILWNLIVFCTTVFAGQKVIIAVIDGSRYTETFGLEDTYIPNMWNNMRPYGTIYTDFNNYGATSTCPGHASIVTGTWQYIANNGNERPLEPTIFEYFRQQLDSSETDNYVVAGKSKLDILTYSEHESYGTEYQASNETRNVDDIVTYDTLVSVMDTYHPDLIIVNFAEVDVAGHTGIWDDYIASLVQVDSLIYELWQKIQTDAYYKDSTTLFITNDHGRHTSDFSGHGDNCEGCRHLMLLAIGNNVTAGQVITETRDQRDLAPTVGDLLGFNTPYANGTSLYIGDTPLPVTLASFTATSGDKEIIINWSTESELNNFCFNIWRSQKFDENFFKINPDPILGQGNSSEHNNYSFIDPNVISGETYYYQLEEIEFNGTSNLYGPVEASLGKMQFEEHENGFIIFQNYPNPFNSTTNISFHLAYPSNVRVAIYDNSGRRITALFNGYMDSGFREVEWRDVNAASGTYFYRIEAGGFQSVKKMILLK